MNHAAPPAEYTETEILWSAADRRLLRVDEQFLLEERGWPDEASAEAAHRRDQEWKDWLTYCHHPSLLMPLECRQKGTRTQVFYRCREPLTCWPVYIEQIFQEYMADEELTLELAFRLTQIWSGMVGKGLRPVALEKPRPDMVLLTGDGHLWALPPRFCPDGETGHVPLLQGMAELLFAALTRHEAASRPEDLRRCRDVNREISLSTQKLVRRCLAGEEEHFDSLGALMRALTQQNIKLNPEKPYRDSGPLVHFRANVPDREFEPEVKEAIEAHKPLEIHNYRPPWWHNPRNLWVVNIVTYLIMMLPFAWDRNPIEMKITSMGLATGIYLMFAALVYQGYRRRIVDKLTRR